MVATLWVRFSEDNELPERVTEEQFRKLVEPLDFLNPNSPAFEALVKMGLSPARASQLESLKHYKGAVYLNCSELIRVLSAGAVKVEKSADGTPRYQPLSGIKKKWKLLKTQIKLDQVLDDVLESEIDPTLSESLLLGFCMQSLLMRLPPHTSVDLAEWLEKPSSAPRGMRGVITRLEQIQKRRGAYSHLWTEMLKHSGDSLNHQGTPPDFFWEDSGKTEDFTVSGAEKDAPSQEWAGVPVVQGNLTGNALFCATLSDAEIVSQMEKLAPPRVLIFSQARPDTIRFFDHADAVLYGEGGLLAHACVIARERGIISMTALGKEFVQFVRTHPVSKIEIDGPRRKIKILS